MASKKFLFDKKFLGQKYFVSKKKFGQKKDPQKLLDRKSKRIVFKYVGAKRIGLIKMFLSYNNLVKIIDRLGA